MESARLIANGVFSHCDMNHIWPIRADDFLVNVAYSVVLYAHAISGETLIESKYKLWIAIRHLVFNATFTNVVNGKVT